MEITARITEAVEASLNHRGYEVVQVRMTGGGKRQIVAVDIDRLDDGSVTVEDCTNASYLISAILDVEDFIKGSYNLEVSSPGESRPLKKISDFERFCGKDVKMELTVAVNNQCKLSGKLLRVEYGESGAIVYLAGRCDTGTAEIGVPHSAIKKASVKRF
ncbi:MAG: ribosome maturation factor RimP [Holosporaceae bacterium]|nr:ribosome maturation factor RimP [Holosporaceae bacterium]